MSATVTGTGLWLNDYLDPSDFVQLPLAPGWSQETAIPGQVQAFAGGTFRAILEEGRPITVTPVLRALDAAGVAQVNRRAGRQQWVRTSTGLRFSGIFFQPKIVWYRPDRAKATFTISELTSSEVV